MSRQLSLEQFFKSKSTASLSNSIMNFDENKAMKKRSLSIKRHGIPNKSPKVSINNKYVSNEVINLCSDDELDSESRVSLRTPIKNLDDDILSNSSESTVIYSLTPTSPFKDKLQNLQCSNTSSPTLRVRSPGSINKYFSPNKKKAVYKKSPVKRNLNKEWTHIQPKPSKENDKVFQEACEDLDDKTVFLLSIINNYLKDNSLKCLLNQDSQNLLENCMYVEKPGMRLVTRLFWYKNIWYKEGKLESILAGKTNNIDKLLLQKVLQSLLHSGFIISSISKGENSMSFEDYTEVLDRNDFKDICKLLKLKMNTKQSAIEALRVYSKQYSITKFFMGNNSNNNIRLIKIMSNKVGTCYKFSELARTTLYRLYILMYLGIDFTLIRERTLELTLIWDKINRETYPIEDEHVTHNASIIFKTNDDFERYIKALTIYEEFIAETNVQKKCAIVITVYNDINTSFEPEMLRYKSIPIWLRRFTPLHLYFKIMAEGIQELKKEGLHTKVLEILNILIKQDYFRQHGRAEWYAEKALILHKNNNYDEAAAVLLEGFKSDLDEEAKDIMRTRAKKIAKQTSHEGLKNELILYAEKEHILEKNLRGEYIHKQPMDRIQTKGKLKYETRVGDERIVQDVEEFCLSDYIRSGMFTDGKHWEGRIITTIFFLLFWDIIYSKLPQCPGIFLTRYQKFPLDLFYKSFYTNRKESIDNRLIQLEETPIHETVHKMDDVWQSRPVHEHSGITRDGISWEEVQVVSLCLGARGLAAICRRLALNYRYTHSGFPDLTLWNTKTMKIRFVEVKSDADKPSIKQIQWMKYLQENGIDTGFCYVGVHTTRSKTRAQ